MSARGTRQEQYHGAQLSSACFHHGSATRSDANGDPGLSYVGLLRNLALHPPARGLPSTDFDVAITESSELNELDGLYLRAGHEICAGVQGLGEQQQRVVE